MVIVPGKFPLQQDCYESGSAEKICGAPGKFQSGSGAICGIGAGCCVSKIPSAYPGSCSRACFFLLKIVKIIMTGKK